MSTDQCTNNEKWALNIGGTAVVVTTYCASNNTSIQFSFKSAFWLPMSKVRWLLVTDTDAILASSTSYVSHAEGNVYLQQNYAYVSLILQCANTDMACQGTASIAAFGGSTFSATSTLLLSKATSSVLLPQAVSSPFGDSGDGNCVRIMSKPGEFAINDYYHLACNVTAPLANGAIFSISVATTLLGSSQIFVLNDRNWNKFSHGIVPDCLNDDCYDTYSSAVLQSWKAQSYEPTQSYHLVFQSKSLLAVSYQVALFISAPQSVYNLTGFGWRKQSDAPAGCSYKLWPSAFVVGEQRGIFYLMKDISSRWSTLRVDMNPPVWVVGTSDNTAWNAPIPSNKTLNNITWYSTDRRSQCQVTFSLMGSA